jgi:hypothetical protein
MISNEELELIKEYIKTCPVCGNTEDIAGNRFDGGFESSCYNNAYFDKYDGMCFPHFESQIKYTSPSKEEFEDLFICIDKNNIRMAILKADYPDTYSVCFSQTNYGKYNPCVEILEDYKMTLTLDNIKSAIKKIDLIAIFS